MSREMKKCLQCGNCCRKTIIEDVYPFDLWREPKLKEATTSVRDSDMFFLKTPCPFSWCVSVRPEKWRCDIYPTRPTICVAHIPGTNQCCSQYDPDDQEYLDEFTDDS